MNNKQTNKQIQPLLNFMNMSPCNFLAIDNIKNLFEGAVFQGK